MRQILGLQWQFLFFFFYIFANSLFLYLKIGLNGVQSFRQILRNLNIGNARNLNRNVFSQQQHRIGNRQARHFSIRKLLNKADFL